jgi:hypothetical protein
MKNAIPGRGKSAAEEHGVQLHSFSLQTGGVQKSGRFCGAGRLVAKLL